MEAHTCPKVREIDRREKVVEGRMAVVQECAPTVICQGTISPSVPRRPLTLEAIRSTARSVMRSQGRNALYADRRIMKPSIIRWRLRTTQPPEASRKGKELMARMVAVKVVGKTRLRLRDRLKR